MDTNYNAMSTSFLSEDELKEIGLKRYGRNVKISRFTRIYSPDKISIGDDVRIDDFCVISGNISLGSNIHIAPFVALYGAKGIVLEDYTGLSAKTTIYSAIDDFSGNYLVGPIHKTEYTNVSGGTVTIRKYVQIGAHCLIFPDLTIEEGCVVGACSMVRHSLEPWGIYYGVPAVRKGTRKQKLLEYVELNDD